MSERTPPLNLTEEEAEYLWEMMKREVGKEEVQYSDHRQTVECLHTKVGELTNQFEDGSGCSLNGEDGQ